MKRYIMSSSFNRAIEHMNKYACGFVTAWREFDSDGNKMSKKEKRRRNKQLEQEIKSSGLTFIRAEGGFIENKGTSLENEVTEETYCVINNRFSNDDFIKLMVKWCGEFDQDAVLVTIPTSDKDSNGHAKTGSAINVKGFYYDKTGAYDSSMVFEHASIQDIEQYFTRICGKNFVLSSTEMFETDWYDIFGVAGHIKGRHDFKQLYPDL